MVAIKDFGMPSCCENCDMCVNRNLDTFYCCITLNDVNIDEKAHDCPLVEIEERKIGKWVFTKTIFDKHGCTAECPSCHKKWKTYDEIRFEKENRFCPNCGAEMRGAENV